MNSSAPNTMSNAARIDSSYRLSSPRTPITSGGRLSTVFYKYGVLVWVAELCSADMLYAG